MLDDFNPDSVQIGIELHCGNRGGIEVCSRDLMRAGFSSSDCVLSAAGAYVQHALVRKLRRVVEYVMGKRLPAHASAQ